MNPQTQVCPVCGTEGKSGRIGIHSRQQKRYRCHGCDRTFSHTQGTALYQLKKPDLFITVSSLLAYGCPVQAVVATYGLSDKTVRDWAARAGQHSQAVHVATVGQQRWDLQHIQADELKVTTQAGVMWMALVMMVSTRLWLGGAVASRRGKDLIEACLAWAARCGLCRPLLLAVDGLNMYVNAAAKVFGSWQHLPGEPRVRWFGWSEIVVTQVVKKAGGQRHQIRRIVAQGCAALGDQLRQQSQGGTQINSAYIERLNATFRQRVGVLVRRNRALARQRGTLVNAMFLQGCVYNFCTAHTSLALELALLHQRRRWVPRTPAMAAGLTDHCWTIAELLTFRVGRKAA